MNTRRSNITNIQFAIALSVWRTIEHNSVAAPNRRTYNYSTAYIHVLNFEGVVIQGRVPIVQADADGIRRHA